MDRYQLLVNEIIANGMLCAGRVAHITHYALQSSRLPGTTVEFGCHTGRTAALLAHLSPNPLWLYDSFEGLPQPGSEDAAGLECFKAGALKVSEDSVRHYFAQHGLRVPLLYKGWFGELTKAQLPDRICFAHLDGDLYTSIRDGLRLIYPRLLRGAACIVDDYGWSGTPGVQRAVDQYLMGKSESAVPLVTGNPNAFQAVIVKL